MIRAPSQVKHNFTSLFVFFFLLNPFCSSKCCCTPRPPKKKSSVPIVRFLFRKIIFFNLVRGFSLVLVIYCIYLFATARGLRPQVVFKCSFTTSWWQDLQHRTSPSSEVMIFDVLVLALPVFCHSHAALYCSAVSFRKGQRCLQK